MKAIVGAFNQEKALVGVFSLIVKTDGLFAALRGSLRLGGTKKQSPASRVWQVACIVETSGQWHH